MTSMKTFIRLAIMTRVKRAVMETNIIIIIKQMTAAAELNNDWEEDGSEGCGSDSDKEDR